VKTVFDFIGKQLTCLYAVEAADQRNRSIKANAVALAIVLENTRQENKVDRRALVGAGSSRRAVRAQDDQ